MGEQRKRLGEDDGGRAPLGGARADEHSDVGCCRACRRRERKGDEAATQEASVAETVTERAGRYQHGGQSGGVRGEHPALTSQAGADARADLAQQGKRRRHGQQRQHRRGADHRKRCDARG
jgi:hypothetical protein